MKNTHRALAVVWGIFTAIFLGLAVFHYDLSGDQWPDLQVAMRPDSQAGSVQILGADVDEPLRNFAAEFNEYVHAQNEASHTANISTMWGYILAAVTSLISLWLEIKNLRKT